MGARVMGAKQHLEPVLALLAEQDPEARARAIVALGLLDARDQARRLRTLLNDPSPGVRWHAVGVLGSMEAREHADAVVALLDDADASVQERALEALGQLGAAQQAAKTASLLKSPGAGIRAAAVRTLGRLSASDHFAEMIDLLTDKDDLVSEAALLALPRLIPGSLPPSQRERLLRKIQAIEADAEYVGPRVRDAAVIVLVRLGARPPAALRALLETELFAPLDGELLASLEWAYDRGARARLDRESEIEHSIESAEDLKAVFKTAGLSLEIAEGIELHGRVSGGARTSLRGLLERLCRASIVVEGDNVVVMTPDSARAHWKKRLDRK